MGVEEGDKVFGSMRGMEECDGRGGWMRGNEKLKGGCGVRMVFHGGW